jgi:pyrrolysine biosynthesis protein PylC
MNRLVVIGGKLQGTEALTLARAAGIPTLLFDRDPKALASLLVDEFVPLDVVEDLEGFLGLLHREDLVLPAMENQEVLDLLEKERERIEERCLGMAFDFDAYRITSSKEASDRLFRSLRLPVPRYYPEGDFPYIGKPDRGSGSEGVQLFQDKEQLKGFQEGILQEYLEGPSYSIEITGKPGNYKTHAVTRIHMDSVFDCCKVTTPCPLSKEDAKNLEEMARTLAEALCLRGIMDLEVIHHQGEMKLLEIDARMPSQTPLAVFYSTGVNLLSEAIRPFLSEIPAVEPGYQASLSELPAHHRFVSYEHYRISPDGVEQLGEHILADAAPLRMERDQFGSDVALTDYHKGKVSWQGVFINSGESLEELERKRRWMKNLLLPSNRD